MSHRRLYSRETVCAWRSTAHCARMGSPGTRKPAPCAIHGIAQCDGAGANPNGSCEPNSTSATPLECKRCKLDVELTKSQRDAIGAGQQPRWRGAAVLIPDGLGDPLLHMQTARDLAHPFESMTSWHPDLASKAEWLLDNGRTACRVRLHRVYCLRQLAAERSSSARSGMHEPALRRRRLV